MGDWYTVGLAAGVAAGIGVALSGVLAPRRAGVAAAAVAAAVAGALVGGFVVEDWTEAVGGAVGGLLGGFGAGQVVQGASRRGATAGGLALLVGAAGAIVAGLAFVPFLGYLEAVALPALGARLRGRAPERYAGLRTLAK